MQHSPFLSDSQVRAVWQLCQVGRLSSEITYQQAVAMVLGRDHPAAMQRGLGYGFGALTSQLNSFNIQQQFAEPPAGANTVASLAATFQ